MCYHCGCYGHKEEDCSLRVAAQGVALDGAEKDDTRPVSREKNPAPETVLDFGPWMMVQKNTRRRKNQAGEAKGVIVAAIKGDTLINNSGGSNPLLSGRK